MPPSARHLLVVLALLVVPSSAGAAARAPSPDKTPPVVVGVAEQGRTLSATTGDWKSKPDAYAYRWQRCDAAGAGCTDVAGATEASFVLGLDDVGGTVRVEVTATNEAGSTTWQSEPSARVAGLPPASTSPPVLTGTAQAGRPLAVSSGEWTYEPESLAYAWERCDGAGSCTAIPGADEPTYVPESGDVGFRLRGVVTIRVWWGSADARSAQSEPVAAPSRFGPGLIVYNSGTVVHVVDPVSGSDTPVPILAPIGFLGFEPYAPALSDDGRTLLVGAGGVTDLCCSFHGLATVGIEGGPARFLHPTYGGQWDSERPRLHPDGNRYLWLGGAARFYESTLDGSAETIDHGGPNGYGFSQMAWAPDGDGFAYDRHDDHLGGSWLVVRGQLLDASGDNGRIHGLDWGSNGKLIFSRNGRILTVDSDGTSAPVHTGRDGILPMFSPDASRFAYVTDARELFVANADGSGEPQRLATGVVKSAIDWAGGTPAP